MEERVYCTYIVASRSHTLYIGMTGNLLKRVFEHKQRTHEGFSSKYNCNRLVWFERFTGPESAIARESLRGGFARRRSL
jgi:putative endonuclease